MESLVINLLESLCAICFRKDQLKWIYFSPESWILKSSLCDLGVFLNPSGIRCSCSGAWWLTDGPISCSRPESTANQGTGHSRFPEISGIGQASEDNGMTSFVSVLWGRREEPICPSPQWNHWGVIGMKEEATCQGVLATLRTTSLCLKWGEKSWHSWLAKTGTWDRQVSRETARTQAWKYFFVDMKVTHWTRIGHAFFIENVPLLTQVSSKADSKSKHTISRKVSLTIATGVISCYFTCL